MKYETQGDRTGETSDSALQRSLNTNTFICGHLLTWPSTVLITTFSEDAAAACHLDTQQHNEKTFYLLAFWITEMHKAGWHALEKHKRHTTSRKIQ